jgi:hypothetical protein
MGVRFPRGLGRAGGLGHAQGLQDGSFRTRPWARDANRSCHVFASALRLQRHGPVIASINTALRRRRGSCHRQSVHTRRRTRPRVHRFRPERAKRGIVARAAVRHARLSRLPFPRARFLPLRANRRRLQSGRSALHDARRKARQRARGTSVPRPPCGRRRCLVLPLCECIGRHRRRRILLLVPVGHDMRSDWVDPVEPRGR